MRVKEQIEALYDNDEIFWDAVELLEGTKFNFYEEIYNQDDYDCLMDKAYREKNLELDYACGSTKACVVFPTFVLKSAFIGRALWESDAEFEDGEMDSSDWENCSHDGDDIILKEDKDAVDYCWIEEEIYKKAVAAGLEDFFNETVRVDSTNVYAQNKYDCSFFAKDYHSKKRWNLEMVNRVKREFGFDSRIPFDFIVYISENYSKPILRRFANFLNAHKINDLHGGNMGWFGDKLRLIDYSGYCSGTESTL